VTGANRDTQWLSDIALLLETHASLRMAVVQLSGADLRRRAPGGKTTVLALVTGIAAHDLYHAGQVQFIKRLCGAKPRHDSRRSHAAGSAAGADTDARARRRSTWQTSKASSRW